MVRDGRLIAISAVQELDEQPTERLMFGITDRTCDKSCINYPMVRKSYLGNWQSGDTKSELRGREPYVRVDCDTALGLTAKVLLDTASSHGNQASFSSSYGGWADTGNFRPDVMQGRLMNLTGGCTNTQGDWSPAGSQICLPRVTGDMGVYPAQTACEVIRDNTEVFVLVGCDPIKNNSIEHTVADHQCLAPGAQISDSGCKFIPINPQPTPSDEYLDAGLGQHRAQHRRRLLQCDGIPFICNGLTATYPDVKMICNAGDTFMSHRQDTNRLIRALTKVEMIVSVDVWWTAATRWADIVLPVSSTRERDGISIGGIDSNDRIYAMKQVIEPEGESMSDCHICEGLAEKMGIWTQFTDSLELIDHIEVAYNRSAASKDTSFKDFLDKGYARHEVPQAARRRVRHGNL